MAWYRTVPRPAPHTNPAHALARDATRADIENVTDDTTPSDETDAQRRERLEREAFEAERIREKERPRFNPLVFGVIAATIQMAIFLWFKYR